MSYKEAQASAFAKKEVAESSQLQIAKNVSFDTVAREWRCKWSEKDDKKSLSALQKILDDRLPRLKQIKGAKVQRIVCGMCKDFKIVVSMPANVYSIWSKGEHAPERDVLTQMKSIPDVTCVETQTYTLMSI